LHSIKKYKVYYTLPDMFLILLCWWRISSIRHFHVLANTWYGLSMLLDMSIVTNNLLRNWPEPQWYAYLKASIYSLSSSKKPIANQASLNDEYNWPLIMRICWQMKVQPFNNRWSLVNLEWKYSPASFTRKNITPIKPVLNLINNMFSSSIIILGRYKSRNYAIITFINVLE